MTPILRPYQTEARYQVNTLLNASRHPILVMPTGTGKTKTATAIIADRISLGRRVYVLVPQVEIFRQWVHETAAAGLNPGTIDSDGIKGASRMLYICMPQSLVNLLPYVPEAIYPDEIITDEAHHSAADTWEAIYRFFHWALRLGLTATPRRTDGKPLNRPGVGYTDIVETITMREAIAAHYLARPLPIVPEIYLGKIPIKNGDYDPEAQAAALGKTQIVGDVIKNYAEVFAGLPVLVACSTFDHAKDMAEAFTAAGWKFDHIHSGLGEKDRARMIREIRAGRLNGLCTVGIGIEGMDIPGLFGLIWLRRTMSLTIYLQFIGRALRPAKGKKYGIILDPVGNLFIHGFPDADRKWSLDATEIDEWGDVDPSLQAATMRRCPFCGVMNAAVNTTCHFCGAELDSPEAKAARARHLPAMVDGELVAVESDGQAQTIRERAESIRREQAETRAAEAAKKREAEEAELSPSGKAGILREGLFTNRRKMFTEAVRNYL